VPAPVPSTRTQEDSDLEAAALRCSKLATEHFENVAPQRALEAIWELVAAGNKYVDRTEPWALAKRAETERLAHVVYQVLETLRILGVMIAPFMPSKAAELRRQLGLDPLLPGAERDLWPSVFGGLAPGTETRAGQALFPRLDKDQIAAALSKLGVQPSAPEPAKPKKDKGAAAVAAAPSDGTIEYDDFAKVELRVAEVLSAERVPKSEKLLKLSVNAGDPAPRQILAGIGQHYAPEQLVGKRVIIVANLKPRKMMGLESHGMVLAASDADSLWVTSIAGEPKPGSAVK
jgi:methionyl-tRNA synthetase